MVSKVKVEITQSSRLLAGPIVDRAVLVKTGSWSFQGAPRSTGGDEAYIFRKLGSESSIRFRGNSFNRGSHGIESVAIIPLRNRTAIIKFYCKVQLQVPGEGSHKFSGGPTSEGLL